jgi:hypothetical protein
MPPQRNGEKSFRDSPLKKLKISFHAAKLLMRIAYRILRETPRREDKAGNRL